MKKEKNPQSRIVFFRHLSTILMGAMIPISVVAIDGSTKTINETFKSQQSVIRVKGKVMDENGEPLPGANIQVEKSTRGVMTDLDGTFEIDVKGSDKLVVSFIGLETQTIPVNNQTNIFVKMKVAAHELEDVTIVAFGKQKKQSIVASIDAINPKELKVPSSNLTTSFAGRMAGVISYQRSGEPGKDNAQFFIRGVTTFGYAQSPLILLDGFEVSTDDLARVEPDNIEKFSIMKDATAAALYGSRGANGVILVTTKQGVEGPAKVSFRLESSISTPTETPKLIDGVRYMNLYNQAQFNDNPLLAPYYSAQKIQNTKENLNSYAFPNLNWYNELFKSQTFNQRYNLNITGGGTVAKYYLSASYNNDNGILKVDNRNNFNNNISIDRFNILSNVSIKMTKTTKVDIKFNSVFEKYNGPVENATDIFNSVMRANPVEFPKYYLPDTNTEYVKHILFGNVGQADMTNPYAQMVKGYKDGFTSNILSQLIVEQDLDPWVKGLKLLGKASIRTYGAYESKRSYEPYFYNIKNYDEISDVYELQQLKKGSDALGDPNTAREANSRVYFELSADWNRNFNDVHQVGAMLVYTQEERMNNSGGSTIQQTLPSRNQGLAGRFLYSYDSKYLSEFNFGYNGSEKFAKKHRFGFFPSVGLGYVISEEKFWEPLSKYVNLFKLKYTYGKVGNDAIAAADQRFFFLSDIGSSNGYRWGKDFNNYYPGFTVNRYANPEITWEIAYKSNFGFEAELFEMANFQLDIFNERRESIYMARAYLPSSMGLTSSVYGNVGEVKSEGFDCSLDLNHSFNKDLWLSGRFNFTYATNKILENEEPQYKYDYLSKKGYPVNQRWGYVAERLFIDENDIFNSPSQELGTKPQPGDIKYKDINRDGRIDQNDKIAIGFSETPEVTYGFGMSAGYKGFDLSFFFQGSARSSFFIDPYAIAPFMGRRNALELIANDHWSPNNPDPYAFWPRLSASDSKNNYESSSTWWIRDGKFLRLKSLEIGYTIPKRYTKKILIDNLRIYATGSNLFCFSDFKLWDPEMGSNGMGYPLQRVYNIGLNINF